MDTITIKIEGRENVSFFISLLQKFNFIKRLQLIKKRLFKIKTLMKHLLNGQKNTLQLMILQEFGATDLLHSMIFAIKDGKGINPL